MLQGPKTEAPSCGSPHSRDGLRPVDSWSQRQLLLKDEAQAEDRMGWGVWTARGSNAGVQGVQGAQPGGETCPLAVTENQSP